MSPILTKPAKCHVRPVWSESSLCAHWVAKDLSFLITKTRLFKYIETFTSKKLKIFRLKNSDIFHTFAQNIDCGYSLEPPQRGGSNEYPQSMFWANIRKIMCTPVNPSFTIQKWGLRGSKIYRHVFVMLMRTAKTLIRLGGCRGWSDFSLGAHVILLVLSWVAQIITNNHP